MSRLLAGAVLFALPALVHGQWTNRYPKNVGFGHQVYLEGYELPTMGSGPMDPAPSPDGKTIVLASRGWLWQLDLATGIANRLTTGAGVDSRPAWSSDGRSIAFVRDNGRTTAVFVRDLASGTERELDRGMALDPTFTPDSKSVVYSNLQDGGDVDLWRVNLSGGMRQRITTELGLELKPQMHPDGNRLVYLSKTRAGGDQVRSRTLSGAGQETTLLQGAIISLTRPALSADGSEVAYSWPGTGGWELRVVALDKPAVSTLLVAEPRGRPLTPAWSPDGRWIYYTEADAGQQLHLFRVNRNGGAPQEVFVRSWDYGTAVGRIVIRTPTGVRLTARDVAGHPLVPTNGMVRFDGQNGLIYFYSEGSIELEAPVGEVEVTAVQGLATPPVTGKFRVGAGASADATLTPVPVWDATAKGWFAGDHHFHLNYGGQIDLAPTDLFAPMRGEAMDVGTPMLANLHNRFENQDQWSFRSAASSPFIVFAQEVRSHFLGHVGLVGTTELFWPWVWGPGYEMHGRDDRTNAEPLAEGRRQGGLGIYVHPVMVPQPFSEAGLASVPIALIPDAVHGAFDLLEISCLWSSDLGSTELWYRLLNAGLQIMPSAGTDVMADLHRTMAIGTTRVYVRPEGPLSWGSYMAALKAGRSFVTTGPMLEFMVDSMGPGDVIVKGNREVSFTLDVHSAMPVDSISVVVNGRAVWSGATQPSPFSRRYAGKVRIPDGGWIGARVVGPKVDRWPAMASQVFGHTAPIWIGRKGSSDPVARRGAVAELSRALDVAEQRLDAGYAGAPIPVLKAYFASARTRLTVLGK
ncbi:MAG: CehA/McbA family metallohydrolase [Cytophagaceae bacterium]|nr:CehA/McbA family metallohydrolase [Gemmatimonadaceae bacterium]